MPIVLPFSRYASSPRRCPSSSAPPSDSDVHTMPAVGTKVALSPEEGSRSTTDGNRATAEV